MNQHAPRVLVCQVCGRTMEPQEMKAAGTVGRGIAETIRQDHPDWKPEGYICLEDLNTYRGRYIGEVIEKEKGDLRKIEQDVLRNLKEHELVSENIPALYAERLTLKDRLADRIAEFGGSWGFIISFFVFMLFWILLNTALLIWRPFDPYPFIFLNLLLSCLAAVQAPVIMMSQNRQEAKDRLRAINDYRVNLKAELEIQTLNDKLDFLLRHQWQHLMEIQQIQTDLIEEVLAHADGGAIAHDHEPGGGGENEPTVP
jgi:uncharacterized membrane protein